MSLESWAEDFLPTKWSRRIAVASVAIATAAAAFLSSLPASFLPAAPEHVFVLRLLVGAVVLLTGSFVVLVLVVRSHRAQSKRIVALEGELAARPAAKTGDIQPLPPIKYDNRGIV